MDETLCPELYKVTNSLLRPRQEDILNRLATCSPLSDLDSVEPLQSYVVLNNECRDLCKLPRIGAKPRDSGADAHLGGRQAKRYSKL